MMSIDTGASPALQLRYEPKPADRDAVRQIIASTEMFSPAELDVAVELVDERLAKGPASGYEFVFVDAPSGPCVAYACYGQIACTIASFDLYWIAVEKSQQGGGLGRRLLAETERLIQGQSGERIYVETSGREQYLPTRAFYERCGYRCEAVLKDFYAPCDDKVIFVKSLPRTQTIVV